MRLGVVILPELRWPGAADVWRRAEELGFAHGWTYDHLAWRSLRDSPWFGAVPTLTAAATVTERMRLGTLVASPNFRHPVTLARDVLALDDISAGRFELGIGAGGVGWDAEILGQEPLSAADRADRYREFVELTDRVLREREVTHHGRWYSAVEARSHPGCVQQPRVPFVLAATGRRGMRLAARHAQTWVTTGEADAGPGAGPAVVARQMALLDEACAEGGRNPSTVGRMVLTGAGLDPGLGSATAFEDLLGRYDEIGVTDLVVHWPRPTEPYAGDVSRFEEIVGRALGS
jgi:alkanesulfonate monooxygenase SsuD/methylene tetrahydromethanopterin reductase-like flavin-dependent oxidoreductase (luciferase family)